MTCSAPQPSSVMADLSDREIQTLSRLVQDHSGLFFPENRRSEIERGVRQAFAASPCQSLDEYIRLLRDPGSGPYYFEQLVNTLTIGETHFFRNAGHFKALSEHVLPEIIDRRRTLRTLRIWSAGCASGEEAYSLAIVLRELLPDIDDWAVTILATDINTSTLERARAGIYGEWSFREDLAKRLRPIYFSQQGNRYELHPKIRQMVTFAPLNLAEDDYPTYRTNTTHMDLIVCRNVMIYFSTAGMRKTIARFHNALAEGGWLLVGHAENSMDMFTQFRSHNYPGATFYQRNGEHSGPLWLPQPVSNNPIEAIAWQPAPVKSLVPEPQLPAVAAPPPEPDIPSNSSSVESSLERARELLFFGHPEQARDMLLVYANDANTAQAQVCLLLGKAYANLGDWPNAELYCQKASEMDRLSVDAHYILALVLQHQARLPEAIQAMKTVVYIDRQHVLGHFGLAELYDRNGQQTLAAKSFSNVMRLLAGYEDGDIVPGCTEITAGRLRQAVDSQQKRCSAIP